MTIAFRDVAWAMGPAVLRRIALALLVNDPGPVSSSRSWAVRALIIMGKHRRPNLWERLTRRRLGKVRVTIAQVDLRTGVRHLLTPDAVAAGRVREGRYIALCGAQVVPAMTGSGTKCQPCQAAAAMPAQRSRNTR